MIDNYGDLWKLSYIKQVFRRLFRKSAAPDEDEEVALLNESEATNPEDVDIPVEKQPAIDISGLWKVFSSDFIGGPPVKAVRGLSLRLFENEITCLLGPNGAGKSTSIAMLMGILKPTAGRILIFGLV